MGEVVVSELSPGATVDSCAPAAAEKLPASKESFRLAVHGIQEYAIFLLDAAGRISSWNAGASEAYGYAAHEIVGQPFSRLFPAEAGEAGRPGRQLDVAKVAGRYEDEGWRERRGGSWCWAKGVT